MKIRYFLFYFILITQFNNKTFAQFQCSTPQISANNILNRSPFINETPTTAGYCMRVYFHIIRRDDGTDGAPDNLVGASLNRLNTDFYPYNITFKWEGTIDYINNTSLYIHPSPSVFTINNHSDGIDIYLFDPDMPPEASSFFYDSRANGVGNSSELYVSGRDNDYPNQPKASSHVISHEMAHVFFLWHTHHGTYIYDNVDSCPELVNGSNSSICGDFVTDTPADPFLNFNVNLNTCQWNGSGQDANGQWYNPDGNNYMAYTRIGCMTYFSPNQVIRMRNAIATLPFLNQCVVINCMSCNTEQALDLYMPDNNPYFDTGFEPNPFEELYNWHMWTSEAIWVRNYDDNSLEHQNPIYKSDGAPNYISVKVKNKTCATSLGTEKLNVYWAKAATSLSWPQNWDGSLTVLNTSLPLGQQDVPLGQFLGSFDIPVILPGEEAIVKLQWVVPNPSDYSMINTEPWHFCLLARIVAVNDPMFIEETSDLNANVRNNNNIAWKNVSVVIPPGGFVDNGSPKIGGVIGVGNPYDEPHTFFLELVKEDLETGKPIYDEAEVGIKMDETLYNAWKRGGEEAQLLESTYDEKRKIVKGNNVILDNLSFNAKETGTLNLTFNFLTKELTEKTNFVYHVIQKDALTGKIIGGETYVIKKPIRQSFFADAGANKEIDVNEPIIISAAQINEPATYNWYDVDGNLIYTGKNLSVSTDVAKKYKLEVIANVDGFKDYSEVEVKIKPSKIISISPNPASNNVNVSYKLNNVSSAYLMVLGNYGAINISNNYILDLNTSQKSIDLNNYPNGFYTVALVCDGQIIDAKILKKQ